MELYKAFEKPDRRLLLQLYNISESNRLKIKKILRSIRDLTNPFLYKGQLINSKLFIELNGYQFNSLRSIEIYLFDLST